MMDFLYSLPPRNFFTTLGMIISVSVMVILLLSEYKLSWRTVVTVAMASAVTITSGIGGQIARKLTYGGWLDFWSFVKNFSEYEGTHYIGAALYVMIAGTLLWLLVMRKDSGIFCKKGFGRYIDILSVYSILQAFIGRMGCLSAGCCYGKAYYGFFSVPCIGCDYPTYPAVYVELLFSFITLVAVLLLYFRKKKTSHIFCIGYGAGVFVAEFMYDHAGTLKVLGLTAIQICALSLIMIGMVFLKFTASKSDKCKK